MPVLFNYLMAGSVHRYEEAEHTETSASSRRRRIRWFDRSGHSSADSSPFASSTATYVSWALSQPVTTVAAFVVLMVLSALLFPQLGRDFFPQVDAGQMRLHVRAPPGTRIESTQEYFADVEAEIRRLVGNDQIDVMLDNIGLPYSGINIALSDSATVGPMDGEILISLTKKHTPTAKLIAMLRRELPRRFAAAAVLFSAGRHRRSGVELRSAGAHRRQSVRTGPERRLRPRRRRISRALARVPGVVDSHVFQVPNAPALTVDMDRALATQTGNDAAGGGRTMCSWPPIRARRPRRTSGSTRATA